MVTLLNANLKQEKAADKKLNSLAEGGVNRRATGRTVSKTPARRAAASSATVKQEDRTRQAARRGSGEAHAALEFPKGRLRSRSSRGPHRGLRLLALLMVAMSAMGSRG